MKRVPWEVRLRQMTEFVALHGCLPGRHGGQLEKQLFNWMGVQQQKYRTGCLTEAQIQAYAEVGILKSVATTEINWLDCYQQFLKFVAEHGEKPKANQASAEEFKLHAWAGYQRKSCACRTKRQQQMLISAGIITESLLKKRLETAPPTASASTALQSCEYTQYDIRFQVEDFIRQLAGEISVMEPAVRCSLCTEAKQCGRTSIAPCSHGNREWLCKQAQVWQRDFDAANDAYFAYLDQLQQEGGHDPYTAEAALRCKFPYLGQHGADAKFVMAVWMQRDKG